MNGVDLHQQRFLVQRCNTIAQIRVRHRENEIVNQFRLVEGELTNLKILIFIERHVWVVHVGGSGPTRFR